MRGEQPLCLLRSAQPAQWRASRSPAVPDAQPRVLHWLHVGVTRPHRAERSELIGSPRGEPKGSMQLKHQAGGGAGHALCRASPAFVSCTLAPQTSSLTWWGADTPSATTERRNTLATRLQSHTEQGPRKHVPPSARACGLWSFAACTDSLRPGLRKLAFSL